MSSFGAWGFIPPFLTIVLALVTKDVILSLFLGILSGTLIIAGGNPAIALMSLTDNLAGVLTDGWNIRIFLFCALLGGLVGLLSKTGATVSFGRWAAKKINSPKTTQLMAWFCGVLIFIDDYFNSLAVGTVMRPIADKNKVSRAKLAYILDSTAAPVCIIAPISSWVVTVMSIIRKSDGFSNLGITEFGFFIRCIPFNLYALLTLLLIVLIAVTGRDFGPMKRAELRARRDSLLFDEERFGVAPGNISVDENSRSKPIDMLFPILLLIVTAIIFFPIVTWMAAVDGVSISSLSQAMKSIPIGTAFNDTDASVALFYAAIFTVAITYIYYLCRRLFTIKTASKALSEGIGSMVPALIILTMAWTIGGIIKNAPADGGLGLAKFLAVAVKDGGFPLCFVPCVVFLLSAFMAFATGTSWGTFTIMIPITLPIVISLAECNSLPTADILTISLFAVSAVLGGGVWGDHASPISDTTILSSTGAGCPHLEHVTTQMPYAIFVAICSVVGFIVGGLFLNGFAAWIATIAVFVVGLVFLPRILKSE